MFRNSLKSCCNYFKPAVSANLIIFSLNIHNFRLHLKINAITISFSGSPQVSRQNRHTNHKMQAGSVKNNTKVSITSDKLLYLKKN